MAPTKLGTVPSEANQKGGLNETTSKEERSPEPRSKLGKGPITDEVEGFGTSFKPARYKTFRGNEREDY